MSRLDEILERMRENLKAKEESRRRLEELAQKARIGSKQAIVLLHKGSKATAEERLNEARKIWMSSGSSHEDILSTLRMGLLQQLGRNMLKRRF